MSRHRRAREITRSTYRRRKSCSRRPRVSACPATLWLPQVAWISFVSRHPFDDAAPIPAPGQIDQMTIPGDHMVADVRLIDRASRTLLVTDAVFFAQRTPENE